MKKFLLLFLLFVLLELKVSAEIVSNNCQKQQIGENRFELHCFNQSQWIKDVHSVWRDFNEVVSVDFRDRKIFVEWRDGNFIELNPFVFYRGKKIYTADIPDSLWTKINWRKVLSSRRGFFKFGVKLNKLNKISGVGFDIVSNAPLTEFDKNLLWVKFGDVGISFRDLLAFFDLRFWRDGNVFSVLVSVVPDASDVSLDPIVASQDGFDNEVTRRARFTGFGWVISFSCSPIADNPWKVGYDLTNSSDKYRWRSFFEWSDLFLPSNAVVKNVKTKFEVISKTGSPDSYIMQNSSKPSLASSCSARWNLINSSEIYKTVNYWVTGWNEFDLGNEAVSDLQSHLDWFAVGLKHVSEVAGQASYVGLGNNVKFSGAELIVEYSVPSEDEFELLNVVVRKRFNWFVFLFFFVGFVFFLGLVLRG